MTKLLTNASAGSSQNCVFYFVICPWLYGQIQNLSTNFVILSICRYKDKILWFCHFVILLFCPYKMTNHKSFVNLSFCYYKMTNGQNFVDLWICHFVITKWQMTNPQNLWFWWFSNLCMTWSSVFSSGLWLVDLFHHKVVRFIIRFHFH